MFKIYKGNNVLAGQVDTIQEAQESVDKNKGWYYKSDKKLNKEELNQHVIWKCMNKQLETHGYTYSDVKTGADYEFFTIGYIKQKSILFNLIKWKSHSHKKVIWYQYLTFRSREEFNEWKKFCIECFKKDLKITERQAQKEFNYFNLSYGLKQNEIY